MLKSKMFFIPGTRRLPLDSDLLFIRNEDHINKVWNEVKSNVEKQYQLIKRVDLINKYNEEFDEVNKDIEEYRDSFNEEAFQIYRPNNIKDFYYDLMDLKFFKRMKYVKELERLRKNLKDAKNDLLPCFENVYKLANDYKNIVAKQIDKQNILCYKPLEKLNEDDDINDDNRVNGAIGIGTKSFFLYKTYPDLFINADDNTLWSLWALSGKNGTDGFGLPSRTNEFIRIDDKNPINPLIKNSWYYYDVLMMYCYRLYEHLNNLYSLNNEYYHSRYVLVWSYLKIISVIDQDIQKYLKLSKEKNEGFNKKKY